LISAEGAQCDSLGQRPRLPAQKNSRALKARNTSINSLLKFIPRFQRFENFADLAPGALPLAISFQAFSLKNVFCNLRLQNRER
jgi:hypothetical protein